MLFKILHGDKSRISTDITPYHEGYCYVTYDGDFYVDVNNERVKLNAQNAESLTGATLATILNSSDAEIPTSKAVKDAIDAGQEVHIGSSAPTSGATLWIDTSMDS